LIVAFVLLLGGAMKRWMNLRWMVMGLLAGVVAGSTWVATAAENGVATAPATMRTTVVDIEGDRFLVIAVAKSS